MRCTLHPDVETNLRCSRCEQPICPKCLVVTPVGARCPKCAALRRLPIYEVSPGQYLKAAGVGLGLAIAAGLLWAIVGPALYLLSFLLPLAIGYSVGEVISLSVNRKRSLGLQVVAGSSLLLSYLIASLLPRMLNPTVMGRAVTAGAVVESTFRILVGLLTNPYALIMLGIGIAIAVSRVR